MTPLPLDGRSILVTRARHQAGQLSESLRALGAEVLEIPAIEIAPPDSFSALDRALGEFERYRWLLVTSSNAVAALRARLDALGISTRRIAAAQIAAVGSATAQALRGLGLEPAVTPREYVAESLLEALGDRVRGQRILLARAAVARDVIPTALRERGAAVDVVDTYRTVVPSESVAKARARLAPERQPPDAATFTSSSTVTNLLALLREAEIPFPPAMQAVSIGPITSGTLRENGLEPAAEADPHNLEGLVAALVRAIGRDA